MANLQPAQFFDLKSYKHVAIFEGCSLVWQALKNIEDYLSKQHLGKIEVEIPQGAYLEKPEHISIGKGTIIEPGAFIRGPCIIGEKCVIRHGAYIRGHLITGDRCVIGHTTEVKNTIFLDDAHAAHFAYVGDSILGNRINLGAGTKCANLKLDDGTVIVHFEGRQIATGLRKFGAIIGDGSQLGCNSVTNPGTLIGKNAMCYPCVNFGGYIPEGSVVKPGAKAQVTTKKK